MLIHSRTVCSDRTRHHAHTITDYVRVNKMGAVSLVARATDLSSSEFENTEMLENLRETSALSLFRLYIAYGSEFLKKPQKMTNFCFRRNDEKTIGHFHPKGPFT